jgi:hypothetical protein
MLFLILYSLNVYDDSMIEEVVGFCNYLQCRWLGVAGDEEALKVMHLEYNRQKSRLMTPNTKKEMLKSSDNMQYFYLTKHTRTCPPKRVKYEIVPRRDHQKIERKKCIEC